MWDLSSAASILIVASLIIMVLPSLFLFSSQGTQIPSTNTFTYLPVGLKRALLLVIDGYHSYEGERRYRYYCGGYLL